MLRRVVSDIRAGQSLASLTLGRLVLIPPVIVFIDLGAHLAAIVSLSAFLVVDYYDGTLARRRSADGPTRRALDSTSDRIAIWAVFIAMTALSYAALPLVLVLGVRDVYCAYSCHRVMRNRFVAIGADWPYRCLNALLAAWVMAAPALSTSARAGALGALCVLSVLVALDLRTAIKRVEAMPTAVTSTVIPAGDVRLWQSRLIMVLRTRLGRRAPGLQHIP
jgi:phosphatidylglycerophosphate synthase